MADALPSGRDRGLRRAVPGQQAGGRGKRHAVNLYDRNGTGAQVWTPQANGALYNPQSGRCLDLPGWSTERGTQTASWDCTAGADQRWFLTA